jgi:hypothetical protein
MFWKSHVTNVAMATKRKVKAMVCLDTMQGVVEKHIVNAVDFEQIKAAAMETIKARGEEVTRRWRNSKWKRKK